MALAASLLPGFQYRVIDGEHTGEVVTIIDNTVIHRKVKVKMLGEEGTILPRQLADEPIGMVRDDGTQVDASNVDQAYIDSLKDLSLSTLVKPLTDPMDERLDKFRPNPTLAHPDRYKRRTMLSGQTDVDFLLTYTADSYRSENDGYPVSFALKGDTQSGKTMLVQVLAIEWAKAMGLPKPMPVFTLSGSAGITDFVMFGQPAPAPDGSGKVVHLPGIVELAGAVGGILYIDEINAIAERFTTSLFPVLDHRHEFTNYGKAIDDGGLPMPEKVKLNMNTWCIATYNEGYEGMVKLNRAVHQRFDHILWDYDPKVEASLIDSQAVLNIGKFFRQARQNRKITQPIGTAVLQRFERNMKHHGVPMAVEIFLGMFDARERGPAKEIMDTKIVSALHEEAKQAAKNEAATTHSNAPTHGAADMLADALRDTDPF